MYNRLSMLVAPKTDQPPLNPTIEALKRDEPMPRPRPRPRSVQIRISISNRLSMLADKVKSDEQASPTAPRPRPRSTRIRKSVYSRLSMLLGHRTDESGPKTSEWPPKISEPIPKTNEPVPEMSEPQPKADELAPKTDEPKSDMDESTPKANEPIPEVDEPAQNDPAIDKLPPTPTPPRDRESEREQRRMGKGRPRPASMFLPGKGGGGGGGYGWEVVGKGNDGEGSEEGSEDTLVGEKANAWRSRRPTTMFYGMEDRAGGRGSATWDVRVDERVRGKRVVVDADIGRRYSEGATKRGMKRVLRGVGESFVGAGKWGSTVSPHRASCGGELYGRTV
ncbi:MAG: hypothetical protein LQ351_002464 [Letrouitia transgressa]|nr:MAG: hypothetical protein LQ351_002464 [Letrouitia transgressa]